MATLQTTYKRRHDQWREGDVATEYGPAQTDSHQVALAAGIGYGLGVKKATADGTCALGVDVDGTSFAVTNFLGITRSDRQRVGAKYANGDAAGVLSRGDIVVKVETAVTEGAKPTVAKATGRIGSTAAAAGYGSIDGRFMSAAAKDGLAVLRLFGKIA